MYRYKCKFCQSIYDDSKNCPFCGAGSGLNEILEDDMLSQDDVEQVVAKTGKNITNTAITLGTIAQLFFPFVAMLTGIPLFIVNLKRFRQDKEVSTGFIFSIMGLIMSVGMLILCISIIVEEWDMFYEIFKY